MVSLYSIYKKTHKEYIIAEAWHRVTYLLTSLNKKYPHIDTQDKISYALEELVLSHINKKVKKFYDLNILETESLKKENNKFTKKINLLTKQKETIVNQMAKTKNYLKNLYEDKVNGIINAEQFKELITNYNNDDEKLKDQLKSIENEINYYTLKESSRKNTKELFNKYQQLEKLNRVIVDEFVDKIYIGKINEETKTRDIEIKWNFE